LCRTADGTTIIASSYHNQLCSFVIPSDLLEPRPQCLILRPQKTLHLPETTNVFAPAPYFALENPDTHHVLVACRDHPIQIFRALPASLTPGDDHHQPHENRSLFSYRLISPQTEAYLSVHSLAWPSPYAAASSSFFVGSNNLIAQFNLHRIGDGPQQVVHTIPSKRHISKGNGVGMRGMVSALSMQNDENYVPTGLLAAGTWTRWVGLYDFARGGECVANWSVADAATSAAIQDITPGSPQRPAARGGIGGAGITQTVWSPEGRYLLVNERQSSGVLIYDVRVTNKVLGFLAGRDALTHQKLDLTVYPDSEGIGGFEVWAGTRDGTVKVWQGVSNDEGCIWPSWDFSTIGEPNSEESLPRSPVGSVSLHKYGSVVATCTGSWRVADNDDDDDMSSSASSSSSSSSSVCSSDESDSSASSTSCSPQPPTKRISSIRTFDTSYLKIWSIRTKPHDEPSPEAVPTSEMEANQADAHGDMSF
jgi:telomerase Cajal body protein 1